MLLVEVVGRDVWFVYRQVIVDENNWICIQ